MIASKNVVQRIRSVILLVEAKLASEPACLQVGDKLCPNLRAEQLADVISHLECASVLFLGQVPADLIPVEEVTSADED